MNTGQFKDTCVANKAAIYIYWLDKLFASK